MPVIARKKQVICGTGLHPSTAEAAPTIPSTTTIAGMARSYTD